jgi:hypothetical protein
MRGKCNYITFILISYFTYGHVSRTPTWSLLLKIYCYYFVLISHVLLSHWKLNLFHPSCVDHLGNISAGIRTIKFLNIIYPYSCYFPLVSWNFLKEQITGAIRTSVGCQMRMGQRCWAERKYSWTTDTREYCLWGWQWNVSIFVFLVRYESVVGMNCVKTSSFLGIERILLIFTLSPCIF